MSQISTINKFDTRTNISIDGNVVRKYDTITDNVQREIRREERTVTKKVERKQHATISLSYALITMGLVAVMVVMCFTYVAAQYKERENYAAITQLEQELSQLKIENDVKENMIYGNIDYEQIKKTAIEEYGMTVPAKNQIVTYTRGENEYVKQFLDVPEQ